MLTEATVLVVNTADSAASPDSKLTHRTNGRASERARAADAYARALTRGHYENFIVASPFVGGQARVDLRRLYAYARTTDDLGDESGALALERLVRWRTEVEEMFAGREPTHPVLLALRETVARTRLSPAPFLALIEANVQDQHVHEYPTWEALRDYCMRSAAPVGRMVLSVFDIRDPRSVALSDDVCVGLQLANFAQDVARDGAIGRRYLIGSELAAAGTAGAVRALCERARSLLSSGVALERSVGPGLRLQLALYRLGGLAICDAIAAGGYRTDLARPTISKATQLALVARVVAAGFFGRSGSGHAQPA